MRFQVPQFIETEDKIVGPLTFKQFIYIAGAGGACVAIYFFLPLFIAVFLILPIAAFGIALAFLKINNRPFVYTVEAFLKYTIGGRLYIWKHQPKENIEKDGEQKEISPSSYIPKVGQSKLGEMTWDLDVKDSPKEPPRDGKMVK